MYVRLRARYRDKATQVVEKMQEQDRYSRAGITYRWLGGLIR